MIMIIIILVIIITIVINKIKACFKFSLYHPDSMTKYLFQTVGEEEASVIFQLQTVLSACQVRCNHWPSSAVKITDTVKYSPVNCDG